MFQKGGVTSEIFCSTEVKQGVCKILVIRSCSRLLHTYRYGIHCTMDRQGALKNLFMYKGIKEGLRIGLKRMTGNGCGLSGGIKGGGGGKWVRPSWFRGGKWVWL